MNDIPPDRQILSLLERLNFSPAYFCFRWNLTYEQLAELCGVSKSTTYHWLGGQSSRREAGKPYRRLMSMADILLTNAPTTEPLIRQWLERHAGEENP